jgi:hypothetical protein
MVKAQLSQAGFTQIREEVIKVPFSSWPHNERLRQIGRWFNVAMTEGTLLSYALKPLTARGWRKEDVKRLIEEAKQECVSRRHQAYCNM